MVSDTNMHCYEIWESTDSLILVEEDHQEKEILTRDASFLLKFKAEDWDEATTLMYRYRVFGLKAISKRVAA